MYTVVQFQSNVIYMVFAPTKKTNIDTNKPCVYFLINISPLTGLAWLACLNDKYIISLTKQLSVHTIYTHIYLSMNTISSIPSLNQYLSKILGFM